MKALGGAVGAFAVLAVLGGSHSGDSFLYVIAVVAAVCAVSTWASARISSFLKIFVAIFSTETIVFGLAAIALREGVWPDRFKDFLPPDSLPLTVAMFSILVFVVANRPTVREMTGIADRYFNQSETGTARIWPLPRFAALERRIAVSMVVFLVLINQAQVAITVRLSFFNRDFFNAIQAKDAASFWRLLLWVFTPWAFVYVFSAVVEFVVQSMLVIRWRRWLTDYYIRHWLGDHAHYRMSLVGAADNPDQRIQEDVNRFIDGGTFGYGIYSYSILLIATLSSLVSFAIVLWNLSGNYAFPGTTIVVPGFLFWVALLYAAIGTLITHFIGRALVKLYFIRQRVEADFRFSLARLREYAEQVALLSGERAEQASLAQRFGAVIGNYLDIVQTRKKLMAFTSLYGQISPIIPYVFAAPFYFAGKIQLGIMSQTAGAFGRVEGALTFFVTYYASLADFKAVVDRLASFDSSIETAHATARSGPNVAPAATTGGAVELNHLQVALPNGRTIVKADGLRFTPGENALITGPSGSGKSTLLRATAGIWPYGSGDIATPEGARALVLPQRPYLPNGSLRECVSYPAAPGSYTDEEIRAALDAAKLSAFKDRLDDVDNWSQRLSGGEQQRLAIARALLAKPDWLLLDEATAALDEKLELDVYRAIAEHLPGTTIISIGHRSTLKSLHKRHLDMQADAEGVYSPV